MARQQLEDHKVDDPKKRIVGKRVADPPEDARKHIVRVPILVNHKALEKDDVLLVFTGLRCVRWVLGYELSCHTA